MSYTFTVDDQDSVTGAVKSPCRVASIANINIAGTLTAVDGVTLNDEDRVLLKDQTNPIQNGIYTWNSTSQLLTRAGGLDSEVFSGMTVVVEEGTSADSMFVLSTNNPIVVDTTALSFTMLAGLAVQGEINTASNVGGGKEVFKQKSSLDFQFRTLTEGSNITITQNTDTLEIAAGGGGSGVVPSWGRMGLTTSTTSAISLTAQTWVPWSYFNDSYVLGGNFVTFSAGTHPTGDFLVIGSSGAGIYECFCSMEYSSNVPNANLDFRFLVNGSPTGVYIGRAGDGSNSPRHVSVNDIISLSASDTVGFGIYKRDTGGNVAFDGCGVLCINRIGP